MAQLSSDYESSSITSESHQFTVVSIHVPKQPPVLVQKVCRICMEQTEKGYISPCKCSGSMKFVHSRCLKMWLTKMASSMSFKRFKQITCEVCQVKYSFEYQKDKHLECANIKRNFRPNFSQYVKFFVAFGVLFLLICVIFILLGMLDHKGPLGQQFRNSVGSVESTKIAFIAVEIILISIFLTVLIIFVVEHGTKTIVTITTIYDYFPNAKVKKNKINPY